MEALLPFDVIIEILVRVPSVKSLIRFKCVCKDWYNLIHGSEFCERHLQESLAIESHHNLSLVSAGKAKRTIYMVDDIHSPSQLTKLRCPFQVNYMELLNIVGSCNGLICLTASDFVHQQFAVCNPSTRTFKEIPSYPATMDDFGYSSSGFGYDNLNNDYKIVSIIVGRSSGKVETMVYSLKANLWAPSSEPQPDLFGLLTHCSGCVSVNSILHWVVDLPYKNQLALARFNISTQEWHKELVIPESLDASSFRCSVQLQLGLLDGCLCVEVARLVFHVNDYVVGVYSGWIMKEYGVEDSWTKLYHLTVTNIGKSWSTPIAYCKTRSKVLLYMSDGESSYSRSHTYWYDPQQQTTEKCQLVLPASLYTHQLCTGSLVSIPGSSHMTEVEVSCEDE